MTTKQHIALYTMALANKMRNEGNDREFYPRLMKEIPYLVLPDALRAYVGWRQPSHFEIRVDGTDNAWMIFPNDKALKILTEENADELLQFHMDLDVKKCVIGEETVIEEFDRLNWGHQHFHTLRIHLLQDIVLDKAVREKMYDTSGRFKGEFHPYYNRSCTMSGEDVREEIGRFERLGFLVAAGKVYERTGILMNRDWFANYVWTGLYMAYSEELAKQTFKYMTFSDEVDKRINQLNFELTDEEKASLGSPELLKIMNEVLCDGYMATYHEL